jgi:putative flavoprotein involved in K+ transport
VVLSTRPPSSAEPGNPGSSAAVARAWLADLAGLIEAGDASRASELFGPDASWRDIVSLTWDIRSVSGQTAITGMLERCIKHVSPTSIRESATWPPILARRADRQVIEVLFDFETDVGDGEGVVRLSLAEGAPRAWTMLTALKTLRDHPERQGARRPNNDDFRSHFGAPNWLDQRQAELSYTDREPIVLIVGAGQAGLTLAARLRALDIDALVLESSPRVGDNWRNRYHSLWLHNDVNLSHLPYLPFPETSPAYLSKDQMGSWLEHYADALDLNVWTSARFGGATWDVGAQRWNAQVGTGRHSVRILPLGTS